MTDPIRVTLSGNSTPLLPTEPRAPSWGGVVPELNPSNYNHDDVCDMNDWACRADAELTTLRQRLAEAEARAEDFKRIGQGFERDMRKHFEQSCNNLQRAEKAEADAARWEGAARKIASMPSPRFHTMSDAVCRALLDEAITTASALVREGGGEQS